MPQRTNQKNSLKQTIKYPKTKYTAPCIEGYTIYSISGCKYCTHSKELLKNKSCKIINCDKYVATLRERDEFYAFIQKYTVKPYKYFPMVFNKGTFIGGYKELLENTK